MSVKPLKQAVVGVAIAATLTATPLSNAGAETPIDGPARRAALRREARSEEVFARAYRDTLAALTAATTDRKLSRHSTSKAEDEENRRALERRLADSKRAMVDASAEETERDHRERIALRRLAADSTNRARAIVDEASAESDVPTRSSLLAEALAHYRTADGAWTEYLARDPDAEDAFESRFWLADARDKAIALEVMLERTPTEVELDAATRAAIAARDAKGDATYLQPAAYFVVDIAEQRLRADYKRFETTLGAQGIERRGEVKRSGSGDDTKVVIEPLPRAIIDAIDARNSYLEHVPTSLDVGGNINRFRMDIAEYHFIYGHFAEAAPLYEKMYHELCGVDPQSYRAWGRLMTMATLDNDVMRARSLAEDALKHSCDPRPEPPEPPRNRFGGFYEDAAKAYQLAENMAPGPKRTDAWRSAAALYKSALEAGPDRDEAPEAAINGANAFAQIAHYDDAIALYTLFNDHYGAAVILDRLMKGDPRATPPVPADPKRYQDRIHFLELAAEGRARAHVITFEYEEAAEDFDAIRRNARFDLDSRRQAGRNAVLLRSHLDTDANTALAVAALREIDAPPKLRAEADLFVALGQYAEWDRRRSDPDASERRSKAIRTLEGFYRHYESLADSADLVTRAAYMLHQLHLAADDHREAKRWCQRTARAFDRFAKEAQERALGSEAADDAAECAYLAVDEDLKTRLDIETKRARYEGSPSRVEAAFRRDFRAIDDKWRVSLEDVVSRYASRHWSVVAIARQGSLYESLRLALEASRVDPRNLSSEIATADRKAAALYATAVLDAGAFGMADPLVERARRRLARLTDSLGDATMRDSLSKLTDPVTHAPFVYRQRMFLDSIPGLYAPRPVEVIPTPLPASP